MGHLHVSKMKFRNPIPDTYSPRNVDRRRPSVMSTSTTAEFRVDLDGEACFDTPIWISSTIPDYWMWKYSSQADPSTDPDIPNIKRQSTSELEGDASVDAIMNQQLISYMSPSQTCSQEKMVQSLIPIWEEEFARNGVHEVGLPPDPGKPLRDDVLRTLSHGIGYEEILMELSNDVKVSSDMLQSINSSMNDENITNIGHCGSLNSIREPSRCPDGGLFQDHVLQKRLETDACPKQLLADQLEATVSVVASQDVKSSDQDALRLLNWLASSQAAEDINSDDDLARETILSPLMPATTINTVLEKANVAYENESQQECEDILDSVHDCYFEELDRKTSQSISNDHSCRSSSSMLIPQLDGSNDDPSPISFVNESSETHKKPGASSQADYWNEATLATSNKHKKKKPGWCSLPIVLGQNLNDSHPNPVNRPSSLIYDERDGRGTSSDMNFNKYPNFLTRSSNDSANCEVESSMIVECSTRDLMRVKRSYQAEPYEYGNQVKKVQLVVKGKEDSFLYSESSHDEKEKMPRDSLISQSAITDQPRECHERNSCLALQMEVEPGDIKADKSNSPSYHTLPLVSSKSNSMLEDASKDGVLLSSVGHHVEVDSRASADLQNYGMSGAATSQGNKEFELPDVENKESVVYMGSCSHKNVDSCVKCTEISNPDHFTSTVAPHSRFTSETDGKFPDCGKLLQMNAVGLSQSPAGPSHSKSTVTSVSGDVLELKGMTFIKKPPKVEFIDEPGRGAQSACGTPSYHVNKKNKTRTCAQDRGLDEFLPFFEGNCLVGEKISSANCGNSNYVHCQENLLGVPVHFQNDGSYLYMLTPAYSPPRSENVRRWLLLDCADSSKMNMISGPSVHPSTKVCSDDVAESQDPQSTFCDQPFMDSASASKPNPNQLQANKNCQESNSPQMNPVVPDARIKQQDEEIILKCESSMRVSQDLSQISGPDRKSRLTPLSQTGFRDPASIGCGQQLTILSIEVQAESRGDLRPDPRFDAVRIVVLVFQEDDDFRSDTHVLLHCNGESVQRDLDGVSECKVFTFFEERLVFLHFIKMINSFDPDIFMGWDIQGGSLGFLAERAAYLGIGLLNKISRTPSEGNIASRDSDGGKLSDIFSETVTADQMFHEDAAIIDDEWGRTHASGVHVGGRIVLNIWRLMRGEVKLNLYTLEAVAEAVLRRKFPYIPNKVLTNWFLSGPGRARYRCIEYFLERAKLNLQIMNQLDVVNRTSELARIFGIDFFSVLSRGSQYRVESMFLRLAHAQNYVAISPGNQQVASQPAMECIPLVMEPKSGFYADPVVVLDFQSLYPSMIIAYNLCFCTCLGKVTSTKANILGVSSYSPDKSVMHNLKDEILLTPNGVMYVPPRVRKGVLPRLLEEILDTRIMVKTAMKKLAPGQQVLHRIFNARQLALKLIANVTYGYTAAGFSGRMPCAELADSIVQCGRRTLESAISFVNTNHRWNAKVIYGDTDSMFVLLEGRSIEEAFRIGHEIASEVTAMNPNPVTLKMEKVYHSCFLLTKKRYVGYSYENVDQSKPVFDAKGIETVRRDTCGAVSKIMERSLRVFFEYRDIEKVKSYLVRQWKKIISGRVSLQDFVFAKEVRLGTYSAQASSLPPAAIVATKAMRVDPRAEPRYAERVPYVVVHGEPGARLADVVVDPLDVLSIDSPYRLNDIYYIKKQIIPALQRVFGLVRADLNQWFSDMPRPEREAAGKRHLFTANAHRTRIDYYYLSKHCIVCGELIQASSYVCQNCSRNEAVIATALTGRTSVLERNIQHLAAICRHCGGGDWLIESGVKCTSLACSVFYERRKIQKELRSLSAVTTEAGFYPRSLSRQDLQILVGYGCPSTDKKVVFSSKLLRKHVHLDEGDVCSSCNLRSSCERAYLLTNKEDEARTIDVMRVLLTYGFDAINGSVANESLMKKKSVKTVVRKLLHEAVKLSAVPIDPNLPPPVFKKPPPKVKQPPPPPRKRVGRDDIEMKKGDWLCPKCDFMNFAKNTICLQCDANRPKRQLLPGEWECSQCNFLNYRRNVVCFHCECKRPADDYMVAQQLERQQGSRTQMDKISRRQDVSNAWNFDFDDDESDGADVATFENADSQKLNEDFPLDRQERRNTSRSNEDGFYKSSRPPKGYEIEYPAPGKPGLGFNDFDDEEDDVDNYEIDSNGANRSSRIDFSDIEVNSESEDIDSVDDTLLVGRRKSSLASDAHFRPRHQKGAFRGSEDAEVEFDTDDELPIKTNMKSSEVSYSKPRSRNKGAPSFDSDDDYGLGSDSNDRDFVGQHSKGNKWGSRGDFGRRRSSHSEDEPFSDSDSNKGRSFHKNKQRGGKVGQNGRWDSSEGRGDRIRDKRTSFRDNMTRSPRDSRGSSRRSQDYGYNDYRSFGREESYKQPRGRNSNYRDQSDSYLDDERYRRPRINVR